MWEAGRKCSDLVLHSHHLFGFMILVCGNQVRHNRKIYYILVCGCALQCNFPSKSEMLIMEIYNATNSYFRANLRSSGKNIQNIEYLVCVRRLLENKWHCTSRYLCSRKYLFKEANALF